MTRGLQLCVTFLILALGLFVFGIFWWPDNPGPGQWFFKTEAILVALSAISGIAHFWMDEID